MSLSVHTYQRESNGEMQILDCDASKDLAGFEKCRTGLWGHESVRDLGAKLLPTLADSDIYAEGDGVAQLEHDIRLVLSHIPEIAAATGFDQAFIMQRAQNILYAVQRAREIGGCVVIW